jgi:hypothetical protein
MPPKGRHGSEILKPLPRCESYTFSAMGLLNTLRARLRRLKGEHLPRQLPTRGPKPRIGAHVVHVEKGLRFVAQAGMSDELWLWLMKQGWRVESYRPDRRDYYDLPASYVTRLVDADPAERKKLLLEAIQNAQPTAALARGHE